MSLTAKMANTIHNRQAMICYSRFAISGPMSRCSMIFTMARATTLYYFRINLEMLYRIIKEDYRTKKKLHMFK